MLLIESIEMYSFLFCLLDVCRSLSSIIRGNEKLFIKLLSNGRGSLRQECFKHLDEPEPDDPSSNSKHISSHRFFFEFPSPGLETEFPR